MGECPPPQCEKSRGLAVNVHCIIIFISSKLVERKTNKVDKKQLN